MKDTLHHNGGATTADELRVQAEMTKDSAKRTARELVDRLRGGGKEKLQERKHIAASHFETAESAVRDAAIRLRANDQSSVAQPLSSLADKIGDVSRFLETNSPEDLADKAADTVRRHPAATLGIALIAGAAVARVLRSAS